MNEIDKNKVCEDIIRDWVTKMYERMYDSRQKGCPDLSEDGTRWRYSFCPKGLAYMDTDVLQALMTKYGPGFITGPKHGGDCCDCVHGHNVSSESGIWPMIEDCDGCLNPTHPHFLPYSNVAEYNAIKKEDVFKIPCGGTIPIYIERLQKGMEDKQYKYYEVNQFVIRLSDGKRICKLKSLGKLGIPGNKRWRT